MTGRSGMRPGRNAPGGLGPGAWSCRRGGGLRCAGPLAVLCLWLCAGLRCGAAAGGEEVDPDDLPRSEIPLPDGSRRYILRYLDQNWRETNAEELLKKNVKADAICFEAKFSTLNGESLQLIKLEDRIVVEDPRRQKYIREKLSHGDNVWICGRLVPAKSGSGGMVELVDIRKMKGDLQQTQVRLERLLKRKDAEGLFDLGHLISRNLTSNMFNFNEHDQFLELRSKAWAAGLELKEKALAPDDLDGLFELARKWKEMLNRNHKYFELVRRILQQDPGHVKASEVAVQEMNLLKFRGQWMSEDQRQKVLEEERRQKDNLTVAQQKEEEAKAKLRAEAIRNRSRLLIEHQAALRTRDAKAREGAIRSLAEAVQHSADPEFGRLGIGILAQMGDPAAIWPGLELACKTSISEVRQEAYEAMAWLGSDAACQSLAVSLKREEDPPTAKIAVEALLAWPERKPAALKILIDGLGNACDPVAAELIAGLQQFTGLKHADRDAWINWWAQRKDR